VVVLAASFSTMVAISIALPFFPAHAAKRFSASQAEIGLILSASPAAQILSSIGWAALSQRVGRALALVTGLCLVSLGCILFAMGDSVPALIFGRACLGVGVQGADSAGTAMLMKHSQDLQRDMAHLEIVLGVGFMVGPAIGGVVSDFFGYTIAAGMGWLRLVGSLKSQVSFAKEPYKTDYILQKRPIILRSLQIEATP